MLILVNKMSWHDLDAAKQPFDESMARQIVDRCMQSVSGSGQPDRAALAKQLDTDLLAEFGPWIAGWQWAASEGGGGGPVQSYCCPTHSIFTGKKPAEETTQRVIASIHEWRNFVIELDRVFQPLQDFYCQSTADAGIQNAARTLLPMVLEYTAATDAWYATFTDVLMWFLESVGYDAAETKKVVAELISGRFDSWVAPSQATMEATIDELPGRIEAHANELSQPDILQRWQALRDHELGDRYTSTQMRPRRPISRDGHADYITRVDEQRGPERAERMRRALTACRADAIADRPLTLEILSQWQSLVLDVATAPTRTGPAFARQGRERYGWKNSTMARFQRCLEEANDRSIPTTVRASRAYLDVLFFHPFEDGNARAARLVLDFILTREGLGLHRCEPIFIMSRSVTDGYEVSWLWSVLDQLTGVMQESDATAAPH